MRRNARAVILAKWKGLMSVAGTLWIVGVPPDGSLVAAESQAYTLKLSRPSYPGARYNISNTVTVVRNADLTGDGIRKSDRLTNGYQFMARLEILEVNQQGVPSKTRFVAEQVTLQQGANQRPLISGGQTVVVTDKDGERTFTAENKLPERFLRMLKEMIGPKPSSSDVETLLTPPGPQRVGDSWSLSPDSAKQLMPPELHNGKLVVEKNASVTCRFVGITNVHGLPCYHVSTTTTATAQPKMAFVLELGERDLYIDTIQLYVNTDNYYPTNESIVSIRNSFTRRVVTRGVGKRDSLMEGATFTDLDELTQTEQQLPLPKSPP